MSNLIRRWAQPLPEFSHPDEEEVGGAHQVSILSAFVSCGPPCEESDCGCDPPPCDSPLDQIGATTTLTVVADKSCSNLFDFDEKTVFGRIQVEV